MLGITQEQHPARCRLFARWKGIDAPILWDPYNRTGSTVVPRFTLVDESGVVRHADAKLPLLKEFLATEYPAPIEAAPPPNVGPEELVPLPNEGVEVREAMAVVLGDPSADPSPLIDALSAIPPGERTPTQTFRLGVAYRMRSDRASAQAGDFAAATEAWQRAIRADPRQYIWRRRLQQYGPLGDKPYPFYGWVAAAQAALASWGEATEPLDVPLTLTERGLPTTGGEATAIAVSPDPEGKLPRDADGALAVESAVALDTRESTTDGRVHVRVKPTPGTTWHGGTDPLVLWVEVPGGWTVEPQGLALELPESATSEAFHLEMETGTLGMHANTHLLRAYVLAPVCRQADGVCLYLRKEFLIRVHRGPSGLAVPEEARRGDE